VPADFSKCSAPHIIFSRPGSFDKNRLIKRLDGSTHAMNQMPSADYNLAESLVSTTIPCSDGNIDAKLCKHLWLYLLNKARPQDAFKAMQGVRWRKQASADAAEAIQNTSHFSFY